MSASSDSKLVTSSNDVAFPRGGATALTPMEVKEISNEAARDVLFESTKPNKRTGSSQMGSSSKRSKNSKKSKKSTDDEDVEEQKAQIENFNFKNLIPGVTLIGQVSSINKMDVTLSFGDNLSGYIPITSISAEVTKQLEMVDAAEEESDDEVAVDEDEQETTTANLHTKTRPELPDLSKLFSVGQWLRAKVVESTNTNTKKKRIQLTIDPAEVNEGLDTSDLIPGNIMQCSVKSVEDHGVIVDVGKSEYSGFISKKNVKELAGATLQYPGQTFLAIIQSKPARRTINLATLDASSKKTTISTISSIDSIQPGILVDALVTDVTKNGVIAKVFGMVTATFNLSSLHDFDFKSLKHKFAIGNQVKARIAAVLLKEGTKKLILSNLAHVLSFKSDPNEIPALESFPVGHIFDEVEVRGSDPNYIYVSFGSSTLFGEVHHSKVDSDKVLEIDYSVGSKHKARVIGYNKFDNLVILSMQPSVIESKYLSTDDIPLGLLITDAVIVSVLPEASGIILKIFDAFEIMVQSNHMSDIKLVYPEKKFKVGSKIKARVLKRQGRKLFATLKRSLVNIEDEVVLNDFDKAAIGFKTPATVEKFVHNGAIVSFFGNLSAFLPKNEISETFVNKASDHLKLGQTVNVRIASINEDARKLIVTLKQSSNLSGSSQDSMSNIESGKTVSEVVTVEKTKDSLICEFEGLGLRAVIYSGHLSDGNFEQNRALLKKTTIGQRFEVLALEKELKNNIVIVSAKKSLIEASKKNEVPAYFKDIVTDDRVIKGYIKSVTNMGLFVAFAGKLTGLVLAKYAVTSKSEDIFQKFYKYQSISCKVIRVDNETKRFLLTLVNKNTENSSNETILNPIDKSKSYLSEYTAGVITKAKINSIKGTQLNVQLGDNLQGRVDITQCFDDFSDIKKQKQPLSQFQKNSEIKVKVIGFHDAKNHRFLPVTHQKSNKTTILELSMLSKELESPDSSSLPNLTSFDKGSRCMAFVNNITKGFVWVSITPQIRGRISFMNLTDDPTIFDDLENKLPIGSALEVQVDDVDIEHNILHLRGRSGELKSFEDVKVGSKYPCRVLKVKDQFVLVELAKDILASSFITDALDDYSEKLSNVFKANDFAIAKVVAIDEGSNKIAVSLKTSESKDRIIESVSDLKRGDIVRGFVKNVTNGGLYVALGRSIHALVRVSDLSDAYLKDWKKYFKPHQVVKGKISSCKEEGRVLMTLKESEVNGDLNTLKKFEDLEVGEIYEGSVKGVTDFGVFVKLDGTLNLSGLCHHSEIADKDVKDVSALFGEGDRVKVKILAVDGDKKQLSLGMKASYFNEDQEDASSESQDDEAESEIKDDDSESESDAENDSDEEMDAFGEESDSDEEMEVDENKDETNNKTNGLSTNGFDWTASILDQADDDSSSDDEDMLSNEKKKKKKRSVKNVVDKTAELNTRAPQSVSDFERLLVGNPNSSVMWMNYMSFQLQLSEIDKAREIGERALKTINYRDEQEKLNIWIALLNLENSFGTDETLDETFTRSCQYMDSLVMHQKLLGILVMSEKFAKADALYRVAIKKFGKVVSTWVSYCSYLLDRKRHDNAHETLSRALQALPKKDHIEVVRKFAQLEFTKGDQEQGRSLFEGLVADAPKRIDLWNVYIDQEIKVGDRSKVEDLFERVLTKKLSRKQAKFFFSKWLSFEEEKGDEQACARVKAKATEYVQSHTKEE